MEMRGAYLRVLVGETALFARINHVSLIAAAEAAKQTTEFRRVAVFHVLHIGTRTPSFTAYIYIVYQLYGCLTHE